MKVLTDFLAALPRRLRWRIGLLYMHFAQKFGTPHLRSWYGPRFVSNYGDATLRMYVSGQYGKFFWRYLSNLNEEYLFLDVGANQGLYSLAAATNPRCSGVFAFEPVAETATLLRANIQLNGAEADVEVVEVAISSSCGESRIQTTPSHSGKAALICDPTSGDENDEVVATVDRTRLSEIIGTDERRIVAKIDVEGHEESVIAELLGSDLEPRIRTVFYEANDERSDSSEIEKWLEQRGFELRRVGTGIHHDVLAERAPVSG